MITEKNQSIRITAVGDLSLNGRYENLLKRFGAAYPVRSLLKRWSQSNLLIGNLESPITYCDRVSPSKCTLRGAPQTTDLLNAASFTVVSLANNHVMDYGPCGMVDTLERLKSEGLRALGAGTDSELAGRPLVLRRNGQMIGMLSYCDVEQSSPLYADRSQGGVARLDVDKCVKDIKALREEVDWVIVNLHWGMEMAQIPSPEQRTIARRLVAAGVDLILGHHPHVLQPMERIDGVPVYYSLGNFLFSEMYWRGERPDGRHFTSRLRLHPLSRLTGWAEIELCRDRETKAKFFPARLNRDLTVTADHRRSRVEQWNWMTSRLDEPDYESQWRKEKVLADARTHWRWSWKPILRRAEMKLFRGGWIPNAVEGT